MIQEFAIHSAVLVAKDLRSLPLLMIEVFLRTQDTDRDAPTFSLSLLYTGTMTGLHAGNRLYPKTSCNQAHIVSLKQEIYLPRYHFDVAMMLRTAQGEKRCTIIADAYVARLVPYRE